MVTLGRRTGEHLPQSPLNPLEMPLSKMNELCVKKAAASCVAQMLGVVGNSLIKWGKTDAVFYGTYIPVVGTTYISTIMAKYEMQGDRFCLEQIINWANMTSLSHVKIDSMSSKVTRKEFYQLIVETCFVQCGVSMGVLVNRENPELDQSPAVAPSASVFPRLEDTVILDHDDQQASIGSS